MACECSKKIWELIKEYDTRRWLELAYRTSAHECHDHEGDLSKKACITLKEVSERLDLIYPRIERVEYELKECLERCKNE